MLQPFLALVLLCACSACGKKSQPPAAASGHHHVAPHGGTLIELGEHAYSLELVRDASTGKLSVYILDGHAENFVRIKAAALELIATVGGEQRPLSLRAVANPATGETVGDTSQFDAQADWLKTTSNFKGALATIEIRGTMFERVAIDFPKGSD